MKGSRPYILSNTEKFSILDFLVDFIYFVYKLTFVYIKPKNLFTFWVIFSQFFTIYFLFEELWMKSGNVFKVTEHLKFVYILLNISFFLLVLEICLLLSLFLTSVCLFTFNFLVFVLKFDKNCKRSKSFIIKIRIVNYLKFVYTQNNLFTLS